ncbi:10954_t:CDS:2, partial [Cetraspora pellucida]
MQGDIQMMEGSEGAQIQGEQLNFRANFERMSLDMLRYFCREWELPENGLKQELIARLAEEGKRRAGWTEVSILRSGKGKNKEAVSTEESVLLEEQVIETSEENLGTTVREANNGLQASPVFEINQPLRRNPEQSIQVGGPFQHQLSEQDTRVYQGSYPAVVLPFSGYQQAHSMQPVPLTTSQPIFNGFSGQQQQQFLPSYSFQPSQQFYKQPSQWSERG